MKIIADLHTHTLMSTHAYSTLQEMTAAAKAAGLSAIAITDHGVSMPGAPGKWYFLNLRSVPHNYMDLLVLRGQETNIVGLEGEVDLEEDCKNRLDWVVASIHPPCFPMEQATPEAITQVWQEVAKNPLVQVIGHCGDPRLSFDYERVIPLFGETGKLVELNEATFAVRPQSVQNCRKIMDLCKRHRVPVVVNSDAHFSARVGQFPNALRLLEELEFPEELVVNSSEERLYTYLKANSRVFEDPELKEGEL